MVILASRYASAWAAVTLLASDLNVIVPLMYWPASVLVSPLAPTASTVTLSFHGTVAANAGTTPTASAIAKATIVANANAVTLFRVFCRISTATLLSAFRPSVMDAFAFRWNPPCILAASRRNAKRTANQ